MPRVIVLMFTMWLVRNHLPDLQAMFQQTFSAAQEAPSLLRRSLTTTPQPYPAPARVLSAANTSATTLEPAPAVWALTTSRPQPLAIPERDLASATEIQLAAQSYRAQLAALSLAP